MGKRTIVILVATMSIVLTLLILLQMNTINKAVQIKEENFAQLVKRCLMVVADRLEEEEIKQLMFSEQIFNRPAGFQRGIDPSGKTTGIISHQKINFSINMTQDEDGVVHAQTTYSEKDTLMPVEGAQQSIQDPDIFKELSQLSTMAQRRFIENYEEPNHRTRLLQNQLLLANRPLDERVDQRVLGVLMAGEFASNGVELEYEYGVKSYINGEEKLIFSSEDYLNKKRFREYQTSLFSRDLGSQKPYYLKVYFPKSKNHFFQEAGFMMVSTLVLMLIIVGVFTYTILIILKQKKLSTVKNDFINNMTHELKTPISTISLASQMMKDTAVSNTPKTLEHIAGVIYDESKRLSMQVEKVLQMAVFNEGRLKLKFKSFDLNEVLTTVVQNFEIKVQSERGTISLNKLATMPTVNGDQVHITNVLFNLLDNAVKYRREEPVIEVTTENKKDYVVVSIQDNGIGIAKEHQKQIFERFFRVPTGNVHDVKGFGLGLHYVYKIISVHNGEINVESTLNKGTKFMIYLPTKQ